MLKFKLWVQHKFQKMGLCYKKVEKNLNYFFQFAKKPKLWVQILKKYYFLLYFLLFYVKFGKKKTEVIVSSLTLTQDLNPQF